MAYGPSVDTVPPSDPIIAVVVVENETSFRTRVPRPILANLLMTGPAC
jgi:hypothetical protein